MKPSESFTKIIQEHLNSSSDDVLSQERQQALDTVMQTGLPDTRQEHWKYTDVRRIANKDFQLASDDRSLTSADITAHSFSKHDCFEVVFHNGQYQSGLSELKTLPDDVVVLSLEDALKSHGDLVKQHINLSDNERTVSFSALNSAFLNQGCLIVVPDNLVLDKPLHLLFLSGLNQELITSQPRNVIVMGKNSEATIIESYIGLDDSSYFTNTITEISLADNSLCRHYKVQQESNKAFHIGSLKTAQSRDARLESHFISLGSALARNDIHARLKGTGSHIFMNGLYMANGKQHIDNHTLVDHLVPNTSSTQVYRGVLNDHGRGVFNGKVVVHKDAQKTDAHQSNANLLLADTAEVDTKPELEIYADDVKCSHGATVGQLDQNMLFYLRSRAIDEETAKSLLTFAFADEVIRKIDFEPIRDKLEQVVIGKLPDADVIQEFTTDQAS